MVQHGSSVDQAWTEIAGWRGETSERLECYMTILHGHGSVTQRGALCVNERYGKLHYRIVLILFRSRVTY
jgi:hypothetical protein